MTAPLNDYDHKQNQPWLVLGQIRDDLKQLRAFAAHLQQHLDWDDAEQLNRDVFVEATHNINVVVNRALARIGDGSRSEG